MFLQSFKKSSLEKQKPSVEKLCLLNLLNFKVRYVWLSGAQGADGGALLPVCVETFPRMGNVLGELGWS